MSFYHLKSVSKIQLKGNIPKSIAVLILTYIISIAIYYPILFLIDDSDNQFIIFIVSLFINTISLVVGVGSSKFFLNMAKGEEFEIKDVLFGFKHFFKIFVLMFLSNIVITIGNLLFIIPGLIAMFMFSQATYILIDNPEMSPVDCLKESTRIMQGNKMQLLLFELSFFGWFLLTSFTFGIAGIFVFPYFNLALANFYLEIK